MIGADLEMAKRKDISMMKKLGSYKGMRHRAGLPVRGQRTRSSFRHGKGAVGVSKKKARK